MTCLVHAQSRDEQRVREMLAQASNASRPQPWAKLMMQADMEAARLEHREFTRGVDVRLVNVQPFGDLNYRWNGIAQTEEYQHDILRRVIRELKGTPAGVDALVELLGFGTYGEWLSNAELSPDRFPGMLLHRKIISIIDAPSWRRLNDIRLIRIEAEAYETWWSLSLAKPRDPELFDVGVSAADYAEGADAARLQAVRLYERVLAAGHDPALRDRLAKLRRREDTGQRAWFRAGD